jgi:hypothetical protein
LQYHTSTVEEEHAGITADSCEDVEMAAAARRSARRASSDQRSESIHSSVSTGKDGDDRLVDSDAWHGCFVASPE